MAETRAGPGERRIPYPVLWLLFVACLVTGAALLSRPEGAWQAAGLGLIAAPLLLLGAVALAYYLLARWRARA